MKLKSAVEAVGMGLLAAILSIVIFMPRETSPNALLTKAQELETNLPFAASPAPTQTPTPIPTALPTVPPQPLVTINNVNSPDGLFSLVMKKQTQQNTVTYTISSVNTTDNTEKQLLTKTDDTSQTLTIPENSWEPTHAYVFLKEETQLVTYYYVLKASGETFTNGDQYINIQDLFAKARPTYTITDVTGWGGYGLLVVNTKTQDGAVGPSFWFDVASRSFIQLSTHFG